jgi:hypothetical protein
LVSKLTMLLEQLMLFVDQVIGLTDRQQTQ